MRRILTEEIRRDFDDPNPDRRLVQTKLQLCGFPGPDDNIAEKNLLVPDKRSPHLIRPHRILRRVKRPARSVDAPIEVPTHWIFAAGRGSSWPDPLPGR